MAFKFMKYLKEWNNWTSSSTIGSPVELDYKSSDKITYSTHKVTLSMGGKNVEVLAKFDTGAKSSSIDFSVAQKLGVNQNLLDKCKELDDIKDIPLTITKVEKEKLEKDWTDKLKSEFPEVSYAKIVKSSSGVSIRAFIRLELSYNGRNIKTNVNLRNRTGLKCEMLVGLDDMV
jgi:hypothetical protein